MFENQLVNWFTIKYYIENPASDIHSTHDVSSVNRTINIYNWIYKNPLHILCICITVLRKEESCASDCCQSKTIFDNFCWTLFSGRESSLENNKA